MGQNINTVSVISMLVLFSFSKCEQQDTAQPDRVCLAKDQILSTFTNLSIFRYRDSDQIIVYSYHGDKKNQYIFSMVDNSLVFLEDSIDVDPDPVLQISQRDHPQFKKLLNEKVSKYVKTMDSLHISDISSDFRAYGITLKIYLRSGAVVVFVENADHVKNQQWVNYLQSMRKLDNHWFFAAEDK